MQISVEILLDDDGLLRKECPYCEEQFKLDPDVQLDETKVYCFNCGIHAPNDRFFTTQQVAYIEDLAKNAAIEQMNKMFGRIKSNSKNLKLKFKPIEKSKVRALVEMPDFETVTLGCCSIQIAVLCPRTRRVIYCPKCGEMNWSL